MMGLGEVGILWLAVPTLANNWFNQKAGTVIGTCMAFTGIGGAIWLQVFNALYAGGNGMDIWTIYIIWGVAALVTSLPFTLFCIRKTPQEAGALPYGKPQTASGKPAGIDASKALKSPVFCPVFLFAGHHQPAYHRCPAVPELYQVAHRRHLRRARRRRHDGYGHDGRAGYLQARPGRCCR